MRAGVSTGPYTILTPREAVTAVPNALTAIEAGSASALNGISAYKRFGPNLASDGVY